MPDDVPRPSKQEKRMDMAGVAKSEPEFPNLTAMADFDRQAHIERSIEAGLSREEAERHADEHLHEWSPTHVAREERDGA